MAKKATKKAVKKAAKKATARRVRREEPRFAEPLTILQVDGALDVLALSLEWEGGVAALASLTDNGDPVNFSREHGLGRNLLPVTWRLPRAFRHVIQWDLWFQGTRTTLRATASVNGSGGFQRPVGAAQAVSRWAAAGEALP